MTVHQKYKLAKKVTIIGAVINALLGLIKLLGGIFFHSHALIADGVHSFSDLFTDLLVLFASKYGSQDADDSHPYGHQRIETAATLLLSLLLILAGIGIVWDSIDELMQFDNAMPGWQSMPIIIISILANEILFRYTFHIGRRIKSQLIIANAWHHRSDAASSMVVFLGLLGSFCGFAYFDVIAAIIVGFMIIKMGCDYSWNSVKELIDTAVSPQLLGEIEAVIRTVPGIKKIHQLRSRSMGHDVLIDVHIQVSPKISVSEGHYIAQRVHKALVEQIQSVTDVIVHVDPEDDEICSPSLDLPNRTLLEELLGPIKKKFPEIIFWDVHYLDGALHIDIVCANPLPQWRTLRDSVISGLKDCSVVKEVRVFSLHEEQ